jgi:predicted membrane GTPase involved in stress response
MLREYPIEQLARSTETRFQLGFAKMVAYCLPSFDDAALQPTVGGLQILGANEMALDAPREMIRKLHQADVALQEPRVRLLRRDGDLHEPVMCVRACVHGGAVEGAIHELVRRGAAIESVNWLHAPVVVRASGRLRDLLGYPAEFAALSNGCGDLKMWLSHYAPVPPGPEDLAA